MNQYLNDRGEKLTEAGEYEAAIAEYNKAISLKPGKAIALVNRGFAQGKLGRHLDKFSSCAQATNVEPNFPEAWNCIKNCKCNSDICRKTIKGGKFLSAEILNKYKGYTAPFYQKLMSTI